jgi:uncharacterized protein YqgC (DUF456 family)
LAAPHFRGLHNTTQLTLIAVCFVGVSLTAIWSTLGLGPPLIRGAILLLLTGGLGYALGYVIERQYVFWIAVAVVQAAWSAGSLLVLRAWGYRLLRRTNRAGEQLPTTDL